MEQVDDIKTDSRRIRFVDSMSDLLSTPWEGEWNGICLQRQLDGDFEELVRLLAPEEDMVPVDEARLTQLPTSEAGARAAALLLGDLRALRRAGHDPSLECVRSYPRDPDAILATDVYSFHVDRADGPTDTFLCSYAGRSSEGLLVDEAMRSVDLPEIRSALLQRFGGEDDESFEAYLEAMHLDLHYRPRPGATPFALGIGNLWRIAVQFPGAPVPAFLHRAPAAPGVPSHRLLLIS